MIYCHLKVKAISHDGFITHSAIRHSYVDGFMENQKYALRMQKEMTEEIEKANAKYPVFVNIPFSGLSRQDQKDIYWNGHRGP